MRLSGQVALVTGAASGNGRGIAERFAEEGCSVVIADVDEQGAQETAALVRNFGQEALVVKTDVSNAGDAERLVSEAENRFGGVDILINNAGVESLIPFLELSEAEWDRIVDVNLKGAFLCAKAAAQHMVKESRAGKIINIASINSKIALKGQTHYASSKGGLIMLTKSMALDLAPHGIRVNAIGPGVIETKMTTQSLADPERRAMLLGKIPMGRVGQPRDIANASLFLVSDESSYITGTTLYVDGGWLIQ
jgi:glucose 1-dehydrogenase